VTVVPVEHRLCVVVVRLSSFFPNHSCWEMIDDPLLAVFSVALGERSWRLRLQGFRIVQLRPLNCLRFDRPRLTAHVVVLVTYLLDLLGSGAPH
jgi:hypothetical protein